MYRRLNNAALALLLLIAALMPSLGIEPFAQVPVAHAQSSLPALPAGWPTTLQLGRSDGPGGAASMKAKAPFGFRYQYLSAGVNTGHGWATWNQPDGQFATYYIQESIAQGITPVFTYYMIYQSLPGGGSEQQAVLSNLNNTVHDAGVLGRSQAVLPEGRRLPEQAGGAARRAGYVGVRPAGRGQRQRRDASPRRWARAASPRWPGCRTPSPGWRRGSSELRNQYAPNVILAYQVSVWGTNVDIAMSDPSDSQVDALGNRAGAFYTSLGAAFDVAFGEFSDRDSAYMELVQGKGPQSWWNASDFSRHARFISRFVATSGKRMVMWQIPLGNTKMRALNNTDPPLPGQPRRVAAGRAGPHPPDGVSRTPA